jgi:threonine/homoserine/homoserine lactone efflux protein
MTHGLAAFMALAALLIVTPGPDMALVTKNALVRGRSAAVYTALGINAGIVVWTLAAALGIAAILRASEPAFTAFRILGAGYLIYLGLQALGLLEGRGAHQRAAPAILEPTRAGGGASFRQGLLSNLFNPKIGVFFTSFLPQFIAPGDKIFAAMLLLGVIFNAMGLLWLLGYALFVSRAGEVLRRPRVKAVLERLTGYALIGFGLKLAADRR